MSDLLYELAGVLVIIFGGAIVLTPLTALAIRFALKPLIDSVGQLWRGQPAQADALARIGALEAEVQDLEKTVRLLREAEEFRRRLEESRLPSPTRTPKYPPLSAPVDHRAEACSPS